MARFCECVTRGDCMGGTAEIICRAEENQGLARGEFEPRALQASSTSEPEEVISHWLERAMALTAAIGLGMMLGWWLAVWVLI